MSHFEKKKIDLLTTCKLVLVCHGNILRSQVLDQYIRHRAGQLGMSPELYSFGVAPREAYEREEELLDEVKKELESRGLQPVVVRSVWDELSRQKIAEADRVLVADDMILHELVRLAGDAGLIEKTMTFYAFIDEGDQDFIDTYDPITKRQNPARFNAAFDELDRIAGKIIKKIYPAASCSNPEP